MKTPLTFISILLIIFSCDNQPFIGYGEKILSETTHSFKDVRTLIDSGTTSEVIIDGKIIQTCPKKGCWVRMKVSESDTLMVRFKDYGFFVPKEGVEQKRILVRGFASMDTTSVEMLRHYAKDAGNSEEEILKINEPKYGVNFLANGVLIEK